MSHERICLVSADGHAGAPTEVYKTYLEEWLHPAFDEYYERHIWRWTPNKEGSFFPPEIGTKFLGTDGYDPERGTAVAWDPNLRLKAMDQAMIACDVLFPDDLNANDPPWGSGLAYATTADGAIAYPPALVRAGARAYNRFLADYCSVDPTRLHGTITLGTLDDVVWCVDEVHRAYESGLRAGILLPLEYDQPLLHHRRYDPLWETCCELDLTVVSHVGKGMPNWLGDDPAVQRFMFFQEVGWFTQRPIWCLIMGGVLERYPNLRLAVTETGVDWFAPLMARLEMQFMAFPVESLSMRPSEYWQRQCFVTHSTFQRREEFEGEAYDSVPNMVFGADVGHPEGWWPVFGWPAPAPQGQDLLYPAVPVEKAYDALLGGLSASKMLPYLQDNFFRAYPSVDRGALDDIVGRIGPTTAELGLV